VKRLAPILLTLIVVLAAFAGGCGGDAAQPASPASVTQLPTGTTADTQAPSDTEPAVASTTPPESTFSQDPTVDSIEYAVSLGGVSHEGEELFFVVGAETETEQEAQLMLRDALAVFGEMQSYFIVQKSANFQGMAPGKWVVIEAYDSNPTNENREFGRRSFPQAYVVKATVLTSDPIPVYEDRLGL
jgi:hypothetical protein